MQRLIFTITGCLLLAGSFAAWAQPVEAVTDKTPVVIKKTAQAVTPETYKGRFIAVGSGGGVTGFSTTYYLLDNGQVFGRRSRDTTFSFIAKQTTANTNRVFSVIEGSCKIKTTKFNNPGNVYKFVRWRKGKQNYKVTWGAPGKTVPANYPKFYDSFMAMIPASLRLK